MKIKLKVFIIASLCFYGAAVAMEFYPAPTKQNPDKTKMLYSSCAWFSDANFDAKPMSEPPMRNDGIIVRAGNYFLSFDKDAELGAIWIADASGLEMKSHNLKVRKNFDISISCDPKIPCRAFFENARIEIGGNFGTRFFNKASNASYGIVRLVDSTMTVKGRFDCILSVNTYIADFKNRAMLNFSLIGNSSISFGEGAIVDSIFSENPKRWGLSYNFEEKDGKIPAIKFGGKAKIDVCEISVKISENIKSGNYTLIDFIDKKSGIEKISGLSLNGKKIKLGETVGVGGRTFSLMMGSASGGKDVRTKNDIILSVK